MTGQLRWRAAIAPWAAAASPVKCSFVGWIEEMRAKAFAPATGHLVLVSSSDFTPNALKVASGRADASASLVQTEPGDGQQEWLRSNLAAVTFVLPGSQRIFR